MGICGSGAAAGPGISNDFLGYHFFDRVFSVAAKALTKMTETAARRYEQKGHRTKPTPLGQYLTRWNAWFRSGLGELDQRGPFFSGMRIVDPGGPL